MSATTSFTANNFNVNGVLRWEISPGSTLYAVYTHGAFNSDVFHRDATLSSQSVSALLHAPADDVRPGQAVVDVPVTAGAVLGAARSTTGSGWRTWTRWFHRAVTRGCSSRIAMTAPGSLPWRGRGETLLRRRMKPRVPSSRMIAIAGIAVVLVAGMADARAEQRFALVIGSNAGWSQDRPLRYAEHDAERVRDVLVSLGGFAADRVELMRDPDTSEVRAALRRLKAIAHDSTAEDTLVFVYYWGTPTISTCTCAGRRCRTASCRIRCAACRRRSASG